MDKWKMLFSNHILVRGWDYYQSGRVYDVKPTAQGYSAVVEGSDEYVVHIYMKNGYVADMDCDCPYAEDGNHCKHMAAVLYELEEKGFEEYKQAYEEQQSCEKQELEEIICKIPLEEMQKLVLQLAMENNSIKSDILLRYANTISESRMKALKTQIESIADKYADYYGNMDWDRVYDYVDELENFILDTTQKMLENRNCMQAFELVNEAFCSAVSQDIDDLNDALFQLGDTCYELWKDILETCDEVQQKEMYTAMKEWAEDRNTDAYIKEYICDFLIQEFRDESVLMAKLAWLDAEIEEGLKHLDDLFSSRYNVENKLVQRIHFMMEMDFTEAEISSYRDRFRQFPAIRALEIDAYLSKGKKQEAMEVLRESIGLDTDYPGLVSQYYKQLIALYYDTGYMDEYKKELKKYIFSCRQDNLDYIYKLKEACSLEEWSNHFEEILKERKLEMIRLDLLKAEGMYDRLLDAVLEEPYIGRLDQYEDVLKEKFPEQVRDRYITYVRQEAVRASYRGAYYNVVQYLKKIKKYPNGAAIANEIASEWRRDYRRRTAMMDELNKGGF